MLYDTEKKILNKEKKRNSEEYKDLAYDLESFIIDNCYPTNRSDNDAIRLEYDGKINLKNKLCEEYERDFVFSRIRPVLVSLEIPEALKGFRMLELLVLECARCMLEQRSYRMTLIYPVVAQYFGITAHNCERLCRYACSFARPDIKFALKYPDLESLTHRTVENVTVKELVDLLVWYIIEKCSFKQKSL